MTDLQTTASPSHLRSLGKRASFVGKRLMSFLGVFPLGIFVVCHLWTNLSSLGGAKSYDAALIESRKHPAFLLLEVLLGLALLIHLIYGLRLMGRWRVNNLEQRTFYNLKFFLQRLSGLGVAFFVLAHVINARIRPSFTEVGHETWEGMRKALHEPATLTVYVLGLLGISYHLANGLWSFLITWGVTATPRSQKVAQVLAVLVLLLLVGLSAAVVYGFVQPIGIGPL